jgi:hypothetical protein
MYLEYGNNFGTEEPILNAIWLLLARKGQNPTNLIDQLSNYLNQMVQLEKDLFGT